VRVRPLPAYAAAMLAVALAAQHVTRPARATEGDAARGQRVFQRCYACHSVDPNETAQLPGPSLFRILGRPAASLTGFEYSPAMQGKGAAGLVWSADAIDRFVSDPPAFVSGTAMGLPPLGDAQERADLIAYLAGQH
jgi:cytochrome c